MVVVVIVALVVVVIVVVAVFRDLLVTVIKVLVDVVVFSSARQLGCGYEVFRYRSLSM